MKKIIGIVGAFAPLTGAAGVDRPRIVQIGISAEEFGKR